MKNTTEKKDIIKHTSEKKEIMESFFAELEELLTRYHANINKGELEITYPLTEKEASRYLWRCGNEGTTVNYDFTCGEGLSTADYKDGNFRYVRFMGYSRIKARKDKRDKKAKT